MKSIISIFTFFLISVTGYAYELQIPKPVDMMKYSESPSEDMYSVSTIYPIGWSGNGYFAFIQEDEVAGRGGVKFLYIVISSTTDKIVWNYLDDWKNTNDVSVAKSIERVRKVLVEHLVKYQIVQNSGVELHPFPYHKDNQVFFPKIGISKKEDKHPFLGDIQSITIFMNRNEKKKRIYVKEDPGALSYWVSGYFASPFEKRILVSIGVEKWGG